MLKGRAMMIRRRTFLVATFSLLAAGSVSAAPKNSSPPAELPSWDKVSKAFDGYFAKDPNRQPLDIITKNQTAPLFDELAKLGWRVSNRDQLLARVPGDNEFVVKTLRSKQGKQFMRDFSKYPDAYDKLDQLAKLPHGKSTVERLAKGPDGYKLLEYMTESSGGKNLQKQLAESPKGRGFTGETGRLYTSGALKDALKRSYAAAAKGKAK
jgi:hypothetical protein